jgi:hypothetical protein
VLGLYVFTLLPGVGYWDTGEMQTVPYLPGIAHPTGFPLFVLGGWAFAHLVPFGNVAWRLSLFAACASAGASGALAAFVADVTGSRLPAVAAALAFAVGDVAWTRGTRADVHDLALFAVALAAALAFRAGRSGAPRTLAAAALAAGLGLATHPVALLALPGIVLVAWPALAAAAARARLTACACLAAPLALYAYVPLRSAFVEAHALDPARALGVRGGAFWDTDAPSSAAAFARYVSGSEFGAGASVARGAGAAGVAHGLAFAREAAYGEYSYLILALALCGFAYLALREPYAAAGLAAIALAGAAFAANFAVESDPWRYLLGGLWAVAACAAAGACALADAVLPQHRRLAPLLATVLLLAGLWPNAGGAARELGRAHRLADARDLGGDVARYARPGSVVVASWTFAAPLAYDAYVEKTFRPHLVCGWPHDVASHFAAWRARYGHVYFVLPPGYATAPYARRIFATSRFQLAELRS